MQRVVLQDVDLESVAAAVGATSYARGTQYVRRRAVVSMAWDAARSRLHGTVRGREDQPYSTEAFFSFGDESSLEFVHSQCSCPVGYDCKHVAALILTATSPVTVPGPAAPGPTAPALAAAAPAATARNAAARAGSPQVSRPGSWERSLESLLGSGPDAGPGRAGGMPLAIELTLPMDVRSQAAGGPPVKVMARLVQPGRNGGWIGGSLSWTKLDSLHYYGDHPAAHVRLLQQMYAVYRASAGQGGYYAYHAYGDGKSLDFSAFESRQLWPLLDEAETVGLRLVHKGKGGPVARHGSAELSLDVTGGEPAVGHERRRAPGLRGALVITPLIRIDGTDADVVPIRFIGSEGHGLVYAGRAEAERASCPFRLAQLTQAVPAQLQRMALDGEHLEVPAAEQARFRDEYYPRLRRAATVISSDGSFTPPVISGPALVLRASYGADHDLSLAWEWAYQVGDAQRRVMLHSVPAGAEAGYRDVNAERNALTAALASLDLPLDRLGLLRRDSPSAAPGQGLALVPHARLGGTGTMRFSTELLPLLADQPGVTVEISGDPADYREAGDSLRIGVSTDEVAGDTDWFDLGITITVEGREVPFLDVFTALARDESHLLLDDGAYFALDKPELRALARLIEEARALRDAPPGELRISRFQAGMWDELTELGVVTRQAAAWQRQVQGLLSLGTIESARPPAALRALLRPYQLDGLAWLAFLWEHQLGGILADDMGLGKTLQTLALISHARQADPAAPPFLIVAPTSVVPNWATESARFTPGLNVVPVSETGSRSGQSLDEIIAGADAVVTSYALLRIDFDAYSKLAWSGLILDEAQFTKNHQSKIYQCARRLQAPFKLAVTGTPMENNLMELWSLLSITAPGLFPSPARFRDYYARPIEKHGQAELLAQLRQRIKPLVKRRTKELVATDLPAKQEQVLQVDLHPRHRKVYQTHLQRERQKVLGLIGDMNANRFTILRSLTLLRQLSLHAGLVDDAYRDLQCSKIDTLLEQLRDVTGGGHRALVFSQFTGFLAVLRAELDAAGVPYCYLDGSTHDRAAVLERFKNGSDPVFLISLKAGGFGLNLTEADYCFLLDPWWNPATEAQAVDRTHRIGQTRNVMVYRLIASGTIEEKVMALKHRKAELFSNVIDSGGEFGGSLDADDIRALLA
jgi:superfamily II DNA or RNA helicase